MPRLSEIPFLDRFRQREAEIQQQPIREMQQAQGVMTLQGLLQQQQEGQAMKAALAQSGGDPAKALPALIQGGHIKAAGTLAELIKNTQPKPAEPFTLAPGARRFGPDGREIAVAPTAPQRPLVVAPGASVLGPDNQPVYTAPAKPEKDEGTWSEPYQLGGATVQKNSKSGQIRQAVARPQVTNVSTTITPPKDVFKNENALRDDYVAASKSFVGIRDAYNTIQGALAGPITAVSTLAGATKFMKMIDPESVVRESELQMALKATGMLDRFMNLHNTVMKGQVLTPNQAAEIKVIARTLYDTAAKQQAQTDRYFGGLAQEYGLSPARVIRNQGAVTRQPDAAPAADGPKIGDVQDGYRFKGGNPADSKNWVKQ